MVLALLDAVRTVQRVAVHYTTYTLRRDVLACLLSAQVRALPGLDSPNKPSGLFVRERSSSSLLRVCFAQLCRANQVLPSEKFTSLLSDLELGLLELIDCKRNHRSHFFRKFCIALTVALDISHFRFHFAICCQLGSLSL